jgi:DNA-binding CsgD family transcriptional regulator
MNAINPRMHYSAMQKNTHVLTDFHCISANEMERHDFYRWLEKRNGFRHFIGARIADFGTSSCFMSVEFEVKRTSPSLEALEDFRAISQHIANVKRLHQNRHSEVPVTTVDSFLSGTTSTALFFLDEIGRFQHANEAGELMIATGAHIKIIDDFLILLDQQSQRKLAVYYSSIGEKESWASSEIFMPIYAATSEASPPFLLRLFRLPQPIIGPGGKWSFWCIFAQFTPEQTVNLHDALVGVFTLTEREAEFAIALHNELTISRASESLKIARNTGRVHLQKIFEKMKINSQTELSMIIERLAAWDLPT